MVGVERRCKYCHDEVVHGWSITLTEQLLLLGLYEMRTLQATGQGLHLFRREHRVPAQLRQDLAKRC